MNRAELFNFGARDPGRQARQRPRRTALRGFGSDRLGVWLGLLRLWNG